MFVFKEARRKDTAEAAALTSSVFTTVGPAIYVFQPSNYPNFTYNVVQVIFVHLTTPSYRNAERQFIKILYPSFYIK